MTATEFHMRRGILISLFALAAAGLFVTLTLPFSPDLKIPVFWICAVTLLLSLFAQIFLTRGSAWTVLVEIVVMYVLFHLVYQLGYLGLRGSDSYMDYTFLKGILETGYLSLGQGVSGWPMLHLFSTAFIDATGLPSLEVAKFLPAVLTSLIVLPLYLISLKIFADPKAAFLSALVLGTIPQFTSFEALFIREAFGIVLIMFGVLFIYMAVRMERVEGYIPVVLLVPVILFSHHLSSFMFLVLLGFILIAGLIIGLFPGSHRSASAFPSIQIVFLLFFVAIVSYWMFQALIVQTPIANFLKEIIGPEKMTPYSGEISLGSPIVTLKGNIIYYGFFILILVAGLLFVKIAFQRFRQKVEDLAFSLNFYLAGVYSFLSLYVVGTLPPPQRFITFGWLFGTISVGSIYAFLKRGSLKAVFVLVILSFVLFNVYNYDNEFITGSFNTISEVSSEQDYIIAQTIMLPDALRSDETKDVYYGDLGLLYAIYDVQDISPWRSKRTKGREVLKIDDYVNQTNLLFLNTETFNYNLEVQKIKVPETYERKVYILGLEDRPMVNKIGEIGPTIILKGAGKPEWGGMN
jgi:hypothetical protein